MLYINDNDLTSIGIKWKDTINVISHSIGLIASKDYNQPVKPYVRFKDKSNRIIAMPAYIGGQFALAGIKWIASFPGNVAAGIPRAHSVTILNDASTGIPLCIINTPLISGIRTASLSGFIINEFIYARRDLRKIDLGIIGFGPIGQLHLQMIFSIIGAMIGRVYIYDIRKVDISKIPPVLKDKIIVCDNWREPYLAADIFITATVSQNAYISLPPKPGSLLLNVSLRDFLPEIMLHVHKMIVDNWEEVCRENTDIENMHRTFGLQKENTYELNDFADKHPFNGLTNNEVVMFNPMGMAAFDIAIGGFYYQEALKGKIGAFLN